MTSDYERYRGKCKGVCEQLCKEDNTLILVRGHYICPIWGEQEHWWVRDQEGNITDPTVRQFPTKGVGAKYIEFNGMCECAECGKLIAEEDAIFMSRYPVCSDMCAMRLVGVSDYA